MSKKDNKKSGQLALALWVLVALALVILFFVEQDKIFSNIKQTDFFGRIFGKTPTFIEEHEIKQPKDQSKNDVAPILEEKELVEIKQNLNNQIQESNVAAENKNAQEQIQKAAESKKETAKVESEKTEPPKQQETKIPEPVKPATMNLKLCFILIDSDGSVSRKEVTRSMAKTDSPLTAAVNALIQGPTVAEEKNGCRSLIPKSTKLIGASVKNGVATLNFSSDFEFNRYGVEGTLGQLQQIVYTATAFPTVDSVQFLIEGDKREYLSSEGVWIGTPLGRNSFK